MILKIAPREIRVVGTMQLPTYFFVLILSLLHFSVIVNGKDYSLYDSTEIHTQLEEWNLKYPDLTRVTSAQEEYGLPAAGSFDDCPFYRPAIGCPNAILTIQDYVTHPEGSESSAILPEILWSGSLHGNERVGPTAVMEAALLLLEAATCESLVKNPMNNNDTVTARRRESYTCRSTLIDSDINEGQRKWLARLVSTRRIVIVPTANALGYYQNRRTEGDVDPNRDFPYDILDPTLCMQTIAARTLNEVFRDHLFQSALTFHAGMEVIGYEWGAPGWYGYASPDELAQDRIAAAYSQYGGGWSQSSSYQYGPMNDLVYAVRGGMEDWAYAGSWDSDQMIPYCEPLTYNGYSRDKTVYNNSTLRSFNMLIETSNSKTPFSNLGTSANVLDQSSSNSGNGHVARNLRLALLSADLVEPYVAILQVNELTLQQDIVPLSEDCLKEIVLPSSTSQVEVAFTVGGALTIDNVQLWFVERDDLISTQREGGIFSMDDECLLQPTNALLSVFEEGFMMGSSSGTGRFSKTGSSPLDYTLSTEGPIFRGTIQIPAGGKDFVVVASARVDSDWTDLPGGPVGPNLFPQSHMANARNDPTWTHESAGKKLQGRLNWFSRPLAIVLETDTGGGSPTTTNSPIAQPTPVPTSPMPTKLPTKLPKFPLTDNPTDTLTESPTRSPLVQTTPFPTVPRTTKTPTKSPVAFLTENPTPVSSTNPTAAATSNFPTTTEPTLAPVTPMPTKLPTKLPTIRRTADPTDSPITSSPTATIPTSRAPTNVEFDDDESSAGASGDISLTLLLMLGLLAGQVHRL